MLNYIYLIDGMCQILFVNQMQWEIAIALYKTI